MLKHLPATPTDTGSHNSCLVGSLCKVLHDRNTFLVPYCLSNLVSSKKAAFTLAEVLITLGIIGVVAAMTIPTLIVNYKKQVVGVKLARFYSTMNQALKMSIAENGQLTFKQINTADSAYLTDWYQKNVTKYIKTIKEEGPESSTSYYKVSFLDGSGFNSYFSGISPDGTQGNRNINIFYCIDYSSCQNGKFDGKNSFLFFLNVSKANIETYPATTCQEGDNQYKWGCATIIQRNNWKIPEDYPIKF